MLSTCFCKTCFWKFCPAICAEHHLVLCALITFRMSLGGESIPTFLSKMQCTAQTISSVSTQPNVPCSLSYDHHPPVCLCGSPDSLWCHAKPDVRWRFVLSTSAPWPGRCGFCHTLTWRSLLCTTVDRWFFFPGRIDAGGYAFVLRDHGRTGRVHQRLCQFFSVLGEKMGFLGPTLNFAFTVDGSCVPCLDTAEPLS